MRNAMYDMLYLTACVMNDIVPDRTRVEAMDREKLYQACQMHFMTALVAEALEAAGVSMEAAWKEAKAKAMRKELLFDAERARILNFMEKQGIWYLPLKGIHLKKYYPKLGMRQMSDNDILYDKTYQEQLCSFMKEQGYQAAAVGTGNHDVYKKEPVFNFEMHTALYSAMTNEKWVEYYADVKTRLLLEEGKQYGYRFRDEDFYIYIISHEYKHYNGSGTGIRSLTDCYAYLKKMREKLDWEYIKAECEKLEIAEFEEKNRQLCLRVLSEPVLPQLSAEEQRMLEEYLFAGIYGTQRRGYAKRIEKFQKKTGSKSRLRYIWDRVFPSMEFYKQFYPFFYKYKVLLPVGWLFRLVRGLTARRRRVVTEFDVLMEMDEK